MTNPTSPNITWHHGSYDRPTRWKKLGLRGVTVWFTGISGSGKSTIAVELEKMLLNAHIPTYRLDGDNIRHGLNGDLSFSREDRIENIRRIGEVSQLFTDSGMVTLACFISPFQNDRGKIRQLHVQQSLPFLEVFVDTPLQVCQNRDPKGLYNKARLGHIPNFFEITYERPTNPDIHLKTEKTKPLALAQKCMNYLIENELIALPD